MALNLGELLIHLGVDLGDMDAKFAAAQKTVSSASAKIEKDMQGFGKTASGLLVPLDALPGKLDKATESVKKTSETVAETGEAFKKTGESAEKTTKSVGQAGEAAKKTGSHMHGAKQQAEGLVGTLGDMQTQMNLLMGGMALSGAFTVPFVAMAKAAAQTSIGFESAFAGVRKTVNATEGEFKDLEGRFRGMSQVVPVAAEELSNIGMLAGQLGVRGVDNLQKFTDVVSKLGVSTNLGTEEAATSLARFANIMQMPIGNADKLGSTIVELGNNLATTEAEITEFALRIAGAGKQVGLSEPQVLGFGAALSSVGINAEAGGTAISRVFSKLAIAAANGGDDLKAFAAVAGVSAGEFATAFQKDAAGATVAFITGLKRMQDEGTNLFGVMETLEMDDIRVRDALLRTAGAGDVLSKSLGLATQAWQSNTALNKEAAQRFATTESAIKMLQNTWDEFTRQIGDAFKPMIIGAIGYLKAFVQVLQDLPMPVKQSIMVLGGLLAIVGPLMIGLAGLGAVIAGVKTAIATLTPVLAAINPVAVGIAIALGVLTLGVTAYATAQKKAQEETAQKATSLIELSSRYAELQNALRDVTKTEAEHQAVSDEEKKTIQEIGDMFPALVTQWDEHGKAVAIDTERLKENTVAARENVQAKNLSDLAALQKGSYDLQKKRDEIQKRIDQQQELLNDFQKAPSAIEAHVLSELGRELSDINQQIDETRGKLARALALVRGGDEVYGPILPPKVVPPKTVIPLTDTEVKAAHDKALTEMVERQRVAMAEVEGALKKTEAAWATFSAVIGEATKGAGYDAERQQYLTTKLEAQQNVVQLLKSQYDEAQQLTGALSETTLGLAGSLNSATTAVAETSAQLREVSGPIADAKTNLSSASEAVKTMQDWLKTLSGRLDEATKALNKTKDAIKELEDSTKTARGGISDTLDAWKTGLQAVTDEMEVLKKSTADNQGDITSAFDVMGREVDAVKTKIRDLGAEMKSLANVKLVGETALDKQMKSLGLQQQQAELALKTLRQSGVGEKDTRVNVLQKQIEKLGLQKEELALQKETTIQPLKDQLNTLADNFVNLNDAQGKIIDTSKELTFDEVKTAIEEYQRKIIDATAEQKRMEDRTKELQASVGDLVPSVEKTLTTFDQAANSIGGFRQKIVDNNMALDKLTAKHDRLQTEYDTLAEVLVKINPAITLANTSFDEAKAKIDAYSKTILENDEALKPLRQLEEEQAKLVAFGNEMIAKYNGELVILVAKENEATAALVALRDAAGAAAAGLATLGSAKAPTPPTPAPAAPPASTVPALTPTQKTNALETAKSQAQAGNLDQAATTLADAWGIDKGTAKANLAPLVGTAATTSADRTTVAEQAAAISRTNVLNNASKMAQSGDIEAAAKALSDAYGMSLEQARANIVSALPQNAAGGVAFKPTVGVFGEAGTEALTPLSWLADRMQAFAETIVSTMGKQALAPLARLDDAFGGFNARVNQAVMGTFGGGGGMSEGGQLAMAGAGGGQPVFNVYIGERQVYDIVVAANEDATRRGRR